MKNLIFSFLLIFPFSSCSYQDDYDPCAPFDTTNINIPEGFTFNFVSKFENFSPFFDFQMLSSTIGYIRSVDEEGDFLLRTEDGCSTWTRIPLTDIENISDLEFMNENTGYISHKSEEGIPIFSKTTNAGLDWEEIETPDFENPLYSLIAYANESIYAIHKFDADSLGTNDSLHIVRYDEQENIWAILRSGINRLSLVDVKNNKLFFNAHSHFYIANLNGTIEHSTSNMNVNQVIRADTDNIYVVDDDYTIKRTPGSGGNSVRTSLDWFTMFDRRGILLDFSLEDGALMLLDLEIDDYYCSSTSTFSSFAIGQRFDLTISSPMEDKPFDSFKGFQKSDDDTYLILFNNEIYELKRL